MTLTVYFLCEFVSSRQRVHAWRYRPTVYQ